MVKQTVKKEYDRALTAKALTALCLRVAIAAYIVYLAWRVISGMLKGGSPIPSLAVIIICILFLGVALVFCAYAWKEYKKALKAAQLPEPKNGDE